MIIGNLVREVGNEMEFKIIGDSCCDLNEELKTKMNVEIVPLTIEVEGKTYIDDESLDTLELLKDMKKSSKTPRTSCPSPNDYMMTYKGEEDVFVVTLSSELSGSYNSAVLAKKLYLEDNKDKFIHIFNSKSASTGQALIAMKIYELIKEGYKREEVVERVEKYISEMKTYFILKSLDNLIKAGRIGLIKGKIATMLSIVPIMEGNDEGKIGLIENVRGSKKAMSRLVDILGEQGMKLEERVLAIAHCNCLERAIDFKEQVMEKYNFKDIVIFETHGISTVYANDGGLIVSF